MRQLREIWGGSFHTHRVIARLDRAIQYAEADVVERTGRGVLDAPVKPGHDRGERRGSGAIGDAANKHQSPTRPKQH